MMLLIMIHYMQIEYYALLIMWIALKSLGNCFQSRIRSHKMKRQNQRAHRQIYKK